MTKPLSTSILVLLIAGSHLPLNAQREDLREPFRRDVDGTPVRRAIPVRPPRPLPENPVEEPVPVRPAVPVATPIPRQPFAPERNERRPERPVPAPVEPEPAPPAPVPAPPEPEPDPAPVREPVMEEEPAPPKRQPVRELLEEEEPAATPVPPPAPAKKAELAAPEMSDPGEIRISPGSTRSPEQAQLAIADTYYARKDHRNAAPEYQRFLELFPHSASRQTALFRLGESYRIMGSVNAAKEQYNALLTQFREGDFVGPAAYRLAELFYQAKEYGAALPLFRKASVRVKELPVAYAARFYAARCMEAVGHKFDARLAYEELVEFKEGNPFQDASRHALALLLRDAGKTADALKHVQTLAKTAESDELKAEATVRSGLWQLELKQPAKAAETLKAAMEMPGIGKWKEIAQLGLIRMLYDTEKYQQVIQDADTKAENLSPETKPELLLLVANSQRQLGKFDAALEGYDEILKTFPKSAQAKEAKYERLVCMYNSEDEGLVAAIDQFVTDNPDADKKEQVLLMKAEALFKKQDYAAAAPLYAQAEKARGLPSALRAEALFKLGWCSVQTEDLETAIRAFTDFLDGYRTHKSVPYALVQRALAYQSQKKLTEAEKDFTELIRKHPKAPERELALQQKGLIRGQQNDNPAMVEAFETLLKDYPKSAASAQAHYWIGWAAFEAKDFKKAATHLTKARELDPKEFFERTSLRTMLALYQLDQRDAVAKEVDDYAKEGKGQVPEEILRWLGTRFYSDKNYERAETYLAMLTKREEAKPADSLHLAKSRLEMKKYAEATESLEKYLTSVKEPPSRALGLLDLAKAQIGTQDYAGAQKSVDEAIRLQPEGKLTGEARIVAGDIKAAQGLWEDAAKMYSSVAVILDNEEVTPRAMERAVNAYKQAGKEPEAAKELNKLLSRYPEYGQAKGLELTP
ncbi:MAG: tetratricopeptide repeat protein [Chthoniobacteraceae bacterium]